ncbi:Pentatricopeptide repeat-containing protein [Camellia lanceoleosa]|uniref:Pentatricopeptide repeat-containing protein n=1 Tax=Camellia lanceoleosa TaxID=1840588 RepID=A0ACC0HJS9_9ERIC|nr:Pentatricopeptide repeat-containing protein [Camellia lanceoleosa]
MLFKKPKLEKIESADASPTTHQQSKRFAEKLDENRKLLNSCVVWREKNLFSWTALISGLVQSGQWIDGFNLFIEMRRVGVDIVDPFILSSIVGASANLAALELGKQIHCLVLSLGYESSLFISNALVDIYAKCSDILAAKTIFDTY